MVAPYRTLSDFAGGAPRPPMFDPDPDLEHTRRIDELCDEFERALQSGHHPQVEEFLSRATPVERSRLAVELLRVAIDYSGTRASDSAQRPRRKTATEANLQNGQASTLGEALEQSVVPTVELAKNSLAIGPSADGTEQPLLERVGDYQLLEVLGSGGMGTVYRARQLTINRIVALKLIRPDRWPGLSVDQRQTAIDRFMRESQAAARREHPHVLTVYDAGHDGSTYFLAMRYVEGGSLADRVRQGPLPSDQVAAYLEAVCRALHAVHQAHIIHRDLKPSNILVERETNIPLVGDFGLAKIVDSDQDLTLSSDFFGTPSYMSPEQVLHPGRVSVATDVYGVGATLYHLLTGRPPFQTPTVAATLQQILTHEPVGPRLLNPAIPLDLETITLKCLEKDHQRRYRSALEVAQELQRFLAGQPIVARPLRWDQKAWRWCTRHRAVSGLLVSLAATLLLFASVSTWLYASERRARGKAEQATRYAKEQLAQAYLQRAGLGDPVTRTGNLPWLVEALRLEAEQPQREFTTRVRIGHLLEETPRLVLLTMHDAPVCDAAFAPDGKHLAIGNAKGLLEIHRLGSQDPPGQVQLDAAVSCLGFSPDSDQVAVGCVTGEIYVVDVGRSVVSWTGPRHDNQVTALDFHPAGQVVASAAADGSVHLWSALDGGLLTAIQHPGPIYDVSFGCDGNEFVVACDDGIAYIHASADGKQQQATAGTDGPVLIAKLHPRQPLVLTGGARQGAAIHERREGKRTVLLEGPTSRIVHTAFNGDGELALVVAAGGAVRLVATNSSAETAHAFEATEPIETAALSPDGAWIALGHATRHVDLWRATPEPQLTVSLLSAEPIRSICFGPARHQLLVVAGSSVRVIEWSSANQQAINVTSINEARFNEAADQLEVIADQRCFGVYQLAEESKVDRQVEVELPLPIKHSAYTSAGRLWAVADNHGQIRFGRQGQESVGTIDAYELAPLANLACDEGGERLAVVSMTGGAWLVDVREAKPAWRPYKLVPAIQWLAFDAEGRSLLALSQDQLAHLNLTDPTNQAQVVAHPVRVTAACLSQAAQAFFVGRADGTVERVDLTTGRRIGEPLSVNSPAEALLVDPSGRFVATITGRSARVWDCARRVPASPLLEGKAGVSAAAFCHGCRFLATGESDGTVRVWDVETGNLVCCWKPSAAIPLACQYNKHLRTLQVMFADETLRSLRLAPDMRPLSVLCADAARLTGFRVDGMGSLVPCSASDTLLSTKSIPQKPRE